MDPPATAKGASASDAASGTPENQNRRSSSRSIKRKRFDDEIVEYSLGLPPTQVHRLGGRQRTTSQNFGSATSTATSSAAAATQSQLAASSGVVSTAAANDSGTTSPRPAGTSAAAATAAASATASQSSAIPSASLAFAGASPSAPKDTTVAASSSSSQPATPVAASGLASTGPTAPAAAGSANRSQMSAFDGGVGSLSAIPPIIASLPEKRARVPKMHGYAMSAASSSALGYAGGSAASSSHSAGASASKKSKKSAPKASSASQQQQQQHQQQTLVQQQVPQLQQHSQSTKDLGRWKPIDDLALILGVQQTNDLRMVHRGIKFSCKFTVSELKARWLALMYEETISRLAVAAMRNLHPELVAAVQAKALYTQQEEELLGGIKSNETPSLEQFQDLLDRNALVFYSARTAKALHTHWQLMKQYSLLPDQQAQLVASATSTSGAGSLASMSGGGGGIGSGGGAGDGFAASALSAAKLQTFAEAEEQLNDAELLAEPHDERIELELTLADRCNKKEIRMLENELTRWTVLVDSLTGIGFMPEFDNQTLAVLRGRLVRYLMRSREISFGRTTVDQAVDVDLALEGPAHKASRRQGTIKLRSNGDFFIVNEGKRPLFIDGAPLLQGSKGRLGNNTIIEMAGLRFIFLINSDLINAIRQESAKMSGPLS